MPCSIELYSSAFLSSPIKGLEFITSITAKPTLVAFKLALNRAVKVSPVFKVGDSKVQILHACLRLSSLSHDVHRRSLV